MFEKTPVGASTGVRADQEASMKTNTLPDHERVGQDGSTVSEKDYTRYSESGCDNCGESPITEFVVYNDNTVLCEQCFETENAS